MIETRKIQTQGPVVWADALRRLAVVAQGDGAPEGVGIRAALAYAVEHESAIAEWVAGGGLDAAGVGASSIGRRARRSDDAPKAEDDAPKAKAPKAKAKAPKAKAKAKAPKAKAKAPKAKAKAKRSGE